MMPQVLVETDRPGVRVLKLNNPERRNALSTSMLRALVEELSSLDESTVGVVLAGSGSCFSAGADFRELSGSRADEEFDDEVAKVISALGACPVPVIAALEGACMGAAAHVALACDVRFAGAGSFIEIPAVRLGLLYSPLAVKWISEHYPRDTVRRLLLLSERFDATTALSAGLVSAVTEQGQSLTAACDSFTQSDPSKRAVVATTKSLLEDIEPGVYDDAHWQSQRRSMLDSPERRQAVGQARNRHHSL